MVALLVNFGCHAQVNMCPLQLPHPTQPDYLSFDESTASSRVLTQLNIKLNFSTMCRCVHVMSISTMI